VERHTHTHTHTHHSCRDLLFQRLSFFLYKKKLTATCEQRQLHLVSAPETGGRVEQLQRRALAANPSASQAMEIFGLRGLSPSRGANPLSPSKVQAPGAQNAPCSAGVKNLFVLAFQRVRASACSVLCDGRRSRGRGRGPIAGWSYGGVGQERGQERGLRGGERREGVGQERLGPSYFFTSLVLGPLNSLLWYVPS